MKQASILLALVSLAGGLHAEWALPKQKPEARETSGRDVKAERLQRAREAEARKEAARKQEETGRQAEKVARERAAEETRRKASEAEEVARKRAAHAAKVDASAVRLVKANEAKHRSRMARINKLAAIYRKQQANAKLEEIAKLEKKEGARYRTRLIELEKQLGKNVVERILESMKSAQTAKRSAPEETR
jgi:colicin import membrane protein